MHGSPSIEKEAVRWSKADTEAYLAIVAVGMLTGIVVAYGRMPLHLPGHKVLWWMPAVLATRLLNRARAGATIGALATVITTLSLGGRLAGGVVMMPMVVVAGVILDAAIRFIDGHQISRWRAVFLLATAASAGNLVCFVKRIFEPAGAFFSVVNLTDLLTAASLYALFGFLAGLLGAVVGYGISGLRGQRNAARKTD
jgi:hypothetical protein